jgi:hypothetical protein
VTTAVAAPPVPAVADLLLARMALPKHSSTNVRKDLGKLLGAEPSDAVLDEEKERLASDGFLAKVTKKSFALTDAGRERALRFLGVDGLPPKITWAQLVAKYLFPRAAGLSESAAAGMKKGEHLSAFLLRRKYALPVGSGTTINRVLEALACKELGFPEETTLAGLLRAALSRKIGSDDKLEKKALCRQFPLFQTGLANAHADAVRFALVRDWLAASADVAPEEPRPAEPFDLDAFAETVRALAFRSPAEDRFYDNKVFIAALWRTSQREPNFPRLTLPEFKARLVEANARHLLHLSRADLVQAMDPRAVAESETSYLNATYHFVLLEEDRP